MGDNIQRVVSMLEEASKLLREGKNVNMYLIKTELVKVTEKFQTVGLRILYFFEKTPGIYFFTLPLEI